MEREQEREEYQKEIGELRHLKKKEKRLSAEQDHGSNFKVSFRDNFTAKIPLCKSTFSICSSSLANLKKFFYNFFRLDNGILAVK